MPITLKILEREDEEVDFGELCPAYPKELQVSVGDNHCWACMDQRSSCPIMSNAEEINHANIVQEEEQKQWEEVKEYYKTHYKK